MAQHEIRHRNTNAVLYAGDGESLRDVVEQAVAAGANLVGAYLVGANLVGAYLVGANLGRAYLVGANLGDANLGDANLGDANLVGANLGDANLVGANLVGANLDGAYLDGAYLDGAYLVGAYLDGGVKLVGNRPILQIGPIGSRCAYLVSYVTNAGVYVRAGCWFGTLAEFGPRVISTHRDSVHGQEYAAAIAMIEAHAQLWTPAEQTVAEAA